MVASAWMGPQRFDYPCGIFVVTVGGVVAVWFGSTLSVDQRIAAITAVLTASALFVAVLAAILAILAYRSSAA
jgi:hypothetical protein